MLFLRRTYTISEEMDRQIYNNIKKKKTFI